MIKKIATIYWNEGGFYFENEPHRRYPTEASMHRAAHGLGFTHVCIQHGRYETGNGFVVDTNIEGRTQLIPKRYRTSLESMK